jgi:hypothetical protein
MEVVGLSFAVIGTADLCIKFVLTTYSFWGLMSLAAQAFID